MAQEILSYLDDDDLQEMDVAGLSGDNVERLIQEHARRGSDSCDHDAELFVRLVQARLEELKSRYVELQCLFYEEQLDREETIEECAEYIREYCDQDQTEDDDEEVAEEEEEPWPWPVTALPDGDGGDGEWEFVHNQSGLNLCGYKVGMAGLELAERRRLLSAFFKRALPDIVERIHGDDYGDPESSRRLRKMANVIAANCRNFKRNDAHRYQFAITDYEMDLEYLKETYYNPMFVWQDWPTTEID